VSSLSHWVSKNTSLPQWIDPPEPQPAAPKKRKMDPIYRFGPKAKPIHYEGATYTTWAQAEAATGKTRAAILWAIKKAARCL
jgi:hypothetical protein